MCAVHSRSALNTLHNVYRILAIYEYEYNYEFQKKKKQIDRHFASFFHMVQ